MRHKRQKMQIQADLTEECPEMKESPEAGGFSRDVPQL